MNCNEFLSRLQRQLDDRLPPEADSQLTHHAQRCEACRARLDLWRSLAAVMPKAAAEIDATLTLAGTSSPRDRVGRWSLVVLAASVVMLWFIVPTDSPREVSTVSQDHVPALTDLGPPEMELGSPEMELGPPVIASREKVVDGSPRLAWTPIDPTDWWERVDGGAWVDQTLPTVQSMREGVAPLGRTLMRAVTILTIGGYDQTS